MRNFIFMIMATCGLLWSCNQESADDKSTLSVNLQKDSDFRELVHLRDTLLGIVLDNKIPTEEIQEALMFKDSEKALTFYGMTAEQFQPIAKRIEIATEKVKDRYPELVKQTRNQAGCSSCMAEDLCPSMCL